MALDSAKLKVGDKVHYLFNDVHKNGIIKIIPPYYTGSIHVVYDCSDWDNFMDCPAKFTELDDLTMGWA